MSRPFRQVDVFGRTSCSGNPVAVVLDAEGLDDDALRRFAVWTNLSETTFVLPPTDPAADYRVRIFARDTEFPFAGHPTLGTARAWLDAGGVPQRSDVVVQECGVGLVPVRIDGEELAFAAPEMIRSGPVEETLRQQVVEILGVDPGRVVDANWLDNGPGWVGLLLDRAETVLGLEPDFARHPGDWKIGVVGPHVGADRPADYELRALCALPGQAPFEDPVTGSLNASAAQWLLASGRVTGGYTARQGTAMGRDGRIRITADGEDVWVGGTADVVLRGTADL